VLEPTNVLNTVLVPISVCMEQNILVLVYFSISLRDYCYCYFIYIHVFL